MLNFIIQYWVECLFGLITLGVGAAAKYFYQLYKKEKNHQKTKEQKEFYAGLERLIEKGAKEAKEREDNLQSQIDIVREGILSIQKITFVKECKELLEEGHEISFDEFQALTNEHSTYNRLGGNSEGDNYFEMVRKKAEKNLTD